MASSSLDYLERSKRISSPVAKELLQIMVEKQSNLSVAADVKTKQELLELADQVGPYICLLKTHIDVILDFDADLVDQLTKLAEKHRFMIFEDRKFADIGNTVRMQYGAGIYRIASWSHFTNCHIIPGEGIIQGLKEVGAPLGRGLLLLAEMSTVDSLANTPQYTAKNVELALKHSDFVAGFIASRRLTDESDFIYMTPGVGLDAKGDALGQQYRSPTQIITHNRSDIIIVGRAIYGPGKDPVVEAQRYQRAGWEAYLARLSSAAPH
ncbi:orotidine 5'-phosphate decarboxylase [Dimargaris cristalligena]|uniref:Orotidine 5'-phosphate decarboxylase n=1 Tax=Dimargaris cristalligena TaxID=215637 RepID=A0A4P9ZZ52_9FUNG|nr:orotidine 5'-phosphate decarboxylase [Dimargaris cristalligena]RKP38678.1 orotidine-5'-phosphate decarboxylase [Dimargaris cristalligena]|eukprot:RKP38678.1 orotidine-5'-phosphate decarboxylase [Dimargaris cristalligena]